MRMLKWGKDFYVGAYENGCEENEKEKRKKIFLLFSNFRRQVWFSLSSSYQEMNVYEREVCHFYFYINTFGMKKNFIKCVWSL